MRRFALLLAATLLLPACAGGDDKPKASPTPRASVPLPTGTPTAAIPAGPKPTTLTRTDLIVGTGETAIPGRTITVNYLGVHYDNGATFDSSFAPGAHPLTIVLGAGEVIQGWDEGLIGMRVGGRRQIIIPPDLAYGPDGRAPSIRPNETLVFVVDLLNVDAGVGPGVNTFGP